MSEICSAKEEAGMTVEWLLWNSAGTCWTGSLRHSQSQVGGSVCL